MNFRVSEVESFRQWRDDEEADVDAFLRRMRGHDEPSELMLAGTAFHAVLESARPGESQSVSANGFTFHIDADIAIALPQVREVRASRTYTNAKRAITVSGQLDAIDGLIVTDHKTTGSFDAERYLAGYQWRYYLDIFEADIFRWNVFEIREIGERDYLVHGFHRLTQHRYPAMRRDCERLAFELAEFASHHLPERCSAKAAA